MRLCLLHLTVSNPLLGRAVPLNLVVIVVVRAAIGAYLDFVCVKERVRLCVYFPSGRVEPESSEPDDK